MMLKNGDNWMAFSLSARYQTRHERINDVVEGLIKAERRVGERAENREE